MSELREDVLAAVEAVRGGGGAETSGDFEAATGADIGATGAGGDADGAERGGGDDSAPVAGDGGGQRPADAGGVSARPRDASGRFAPKAAASPTEAPKPGEATPPPVAPKQGAQSTTQAPPPATQTSTPPPEFKPPQSWKPEAREHFAKAPPQVQAEVIRREREVQAALQETAGVRRFAETFAQRTAPLRQLGVDPMQGLEGYVRATHTLSVGQPQEKAALVADIIRKAGVPVEALAAALDAPVPQAPAVDPQAIAQQVRQSLLQEFQAQQQERLARQADAEVATWAERFEFLDDVRDTMSDLMLAAAQGGRKMSEDQAYKLACSMDERISGILQQRQEAERAKAVNASTQRARAAASSVKHQPATATVEGDEPETVFDAVKAAYRKHAAR